MENIENTTETLEGNQSESLENMRKRIGSLKRIKKYETRGILKDRANVRETIQHSIDLANIGNVRMYS